MKKFSKHLLAGISGTVLALLMTTSAFAAVSVKVTGDDDHPLHLHTEYKEWLDASYDLKESTTADKVILETLANAGYTYTFYEDSGYLANITSPENVTLPGAENLVYGGWMFKVNGEMAPVGMTQYEVKDNDAIELFYLDDYRELYGYGANFTVSPEDAEVRIFDSENNEMFDYGWGYSLPKGTYTYTVSRLGYTAKDGSFEITNDDAFIEVSLDKKENTAVVKVTGDSIHEPKAHTAYEQWAASEAEVKEGDTAETLILAALASQGYEPVYNDSYGYSYLAGVKTPDGIVLSEFTNGSYSGWMFKVNGIIPDVTMGQYEVKSGDEVELFYLDDYRELYGYGLTINSNYSADVTVVSGSGLVVEENPWGGYSLAKGTYTYKAEKEGFKTVEGSFDVIDDDVVLDIVLEPEFIWGDYNLDGELKAEDAAMILQKVLLSTYPAPYENTTYIDVDLKDGITANDSAVVLSKVLNGSYTMPCEEAVS